MKFCFFGNVSHSLKDQTPGGGELQIALLAKTLALKGHDVVVIDPYSPESFITEEGVKLINIPNWNKGLPGIRLLFYRIPALRKILAEQKADIYYVRMRYYLHFLSYQAARRNRAKFVQAIANDIDLLSFWGKIKFKYKNNFNLFRFLTLDLPNDLVFNYLLKKSDYIIVQHAGQKVQLNSFKDKVRIFSNIYKFDHVPEKNNTSKEYYIQVGTISLVKGAENLFKLVKEINKKASILIVGQPIDRKSKYIYEELRKFENVILKGRLRHSETIKLISNAKALISTSNFEGFPNIFLEAWASGVPVISLKINPGNVINRYGLGICCEGDMNKMKMYIDNNETEHIDKERLISYVSEYHEFDNAGVRFINIINNA